MLTRGINLNPGSVTVIDKHNIWDDFPFYNCNFPVNSTEPK